MLRILSFLIIFSFPLHAKLVDLELKMDYTYKKNKEVIKTNLKTRLGQLFYIDRKEFRAELQADSHPSLKDSLIIRGVVYRKKSNGNELLISRPKLTIAYGSQKRFSVEDRLRRKLSISVSPIKNGTTRSPALAPYQL